MSFGLVQEFKLLLDLINIMILSDPHNVSKGVDSRRLKFTDTSCPSFHFPGSSSFCLQQYSWKVQR